MSDERTTADVGQMIVLDSPRGYQDALNSDRYRTRLELMLSGTDVTVDRFVGMTVQALARDPKLLTPDIDRESLLLAILTVAEMGLTPTGEGGAHLVPYHNSKTGKKDVQAIIDWRAFIKMAMRSGQLLSVKAELVYEGDVIEVELGDTPRLLHIPTLGRSEGAEQRGDVTHVYAVAHLTNGAKVFEVMTMAEIGAIRDRARPSDRSPWVTDPGEMYRKTAIRRLFKYLPVAVPPALAAALQREDDLEREAVTTPRVLSSRQARILAHAAGTEGAEETAEAVVGNAERLPEDGL